MLFEPLSQRGPAHAFLSQHMLSPRFNRLIAKD